ncbi:MAG: transglycosylase [bacterium]|nr:transglycosylase [bacterium]
MSDLSRNAFALLLLAALCTACARDVPRPTAPAPAEPTIEAPVTADTALRSVPLSEFPPLIDDGDWQSLDEAIGRSRRWLAGRPSGTSFTFGPRTLEAAEMVEALDLIRGWIAAEPTPETFAAQVAQHFDVLESVGGADGADGGMLITGYYEPVIEGSKRRRREYQVPIYGPPSDIIRVDLGLFSDEWKGRKTAGRLRGNTLVPYPDRAEIRADGLGRAKIIAWARDPVDLFFIEVQGSGALALPNGKEMRIGYAGSNGRQYRSIGRLLIDEGKIPREQISMQSIRAYLAAHPEEIERVLDYNQAVVFFRKLDSAPVGSLGFPVTPRRSIATDHRLFPRGALGFLATDLPAMAEDGSTVAEGTLTRFVLNQDRGGAIRGAGRVDFFWGRGEEASMRAGVMKQPGRLFFLVQKAVDEDPTVEPEPLGG